MQFILDVDYRLCINWIIHQQLWEYKVEETLHLGVREQKNKLNTTGLNNIQQSSSCPITSNTYLR
jgi:hypothetical protein